MSLTNADTPAHGTTSARVVDPVQAIRHGLANVVRWEGRDPRSVFWWFALAMFFVQCVGLYLGAYTWPPLYYVVLAATFVPLISAAARRLHDTDHSAGWLLIALVPFVGPIVLLVLLVSKGTNGGNRYGNDPLLTQR